MARDYHRGLDIIADLRHDELPAAAQVDDVVAAAAAAAVDEEEDAVPAPRAWFRG